MLPFPHYGKISSDQPLVITDDFPPNGAGKLDLDGRNLTSFTFAPGLTACSVQASLGLRRRVGDPAFSRACIDFSNRSPGPSHNPDSEQGVLFRDSQNFNGSRETCAWR
jgi:hypothetical protein